MLTLVQRVKLKQLKALYGYDLAANKGQIDKQDDEETLESLMAFHVSNQIADIMNDGAAVLGEEGRAYILLAAAKAVFSGLNNLDKESGLVDQARVMILSELEQALGESDGNRPKGGRAP
jgi:hypothetical protein